MKIAGPFFITGINSILPYGIGTDAAWKSFGTEEIFFTEYKDCLVARLSIEAENELQSLKQESKEYSRLDRTVLIGILATRGLKLNNEKNYTLFAASSRGATELWEKHHLESINNGKISALTSPLTTLGNIATWIAQDIGNFTESEILSSEFSVTCSSGLFALANGCIWNKSMGVNSIVVASEAALTDFTLSQINALGLRSNSTPKPLDNNATKNTFCLGEGSVALEISIAEELSLAKILGIGLSQEKIYSPTGISGCAIKKSITEALAAANLEAEDIDCIIPHAPGTLLGDAVEAKVLAYVFGKNIPGVAIHKNQIGHTYATSGLISILHGIGLVNGQCSANKLSYKTTIPIYDNANSPKTVLCISAGFGGNAVSVILSKH